MRSWGGRVLDHKSLVRVVRRFWTLFEVVGFGVLGLLREFIGRRLRRRCLGSTVLLVVNFLVVRNGGDWRKEVDMVVRFFGVQLGFLV